MRLICLTENTSCDEAIIAQHGVSFYIETGNRVLLFDMGQSEVFAQNAAVLGVDLTRVDTAVISHGHYDHGGGLATFLSLNDHAPIYIHRDAFNPYYNATDKYIGLDVSLQRHPRLCQTYKTHDLGDGITLYADALSIGHLAHGSAGLTAEENGIRVPDDFRHEQYLLIRENGKRILISGCSHRGILEILEAFQPDILIGGLHLSKAAPSQVVHHYAAALNRYSTAFYACHCTGTEQAHALQKVVPRLHTVCAGQTLTL